MGVHITGTDRTETIKAFGGNDTIFGSLGTDMLRGETVVATDGRSFKTEVRKLLLQR